MSQIVIAPRFCGPPNSGNGGYSCGVVANFVGPRAEVTLHVPPPLDTALHVECDDEAVIVRDGTVIVATAKVSDAPVSVEDPVSFEEAQHAQHAKSVIDEHPFPTCFVCGPARAEGDGLRILPGRIEGRLLVAAAWIPDASLDDGGGRVAPEFVWCALDCPSGWAVELLPHTNRGPALLGRLTAHLLNPVTVGERCVVIGWPLGVDGRKMFGGSAVYGEDGRLCAVGRAVWIVPTRG